MDVVVAGWAGHEGLAPAFCHDFRPCWSWLPQRVEAGQFGDVVHLHLTDVLAYLAPSFEEPEDQLLAPGGGWKRFAVDNDRVALSSQ